MPKQKKNHNDFRKAVCLLCFKKGKGFECINEAQRDIIENHVISGLSLLDERLPTVLCVSCRITINKYRNNDFSVSLKDTIYDYSKLNSLQTVTRTSPTCSCVICYIGRSTPFSKVTNTENMRPIQSCRGRPRTQSDPPTAIKICSACLTPIGRGIAHSCLNSDRVNNIKLLIDNSPTKTDEKIASSILNEKHISDNVIRLTRAQGGQSMSVSIGNTATTNQTCITVDDFKKMSQHLDISVNKTLNLATDLRIISSKRKFVSPGLKRKLGESSHALDELFKVKMLSLKAKLPGGVYDFVRTPVVYCVDIEGMIDYVIEERGRSDDIEFKLGVDGGGGFLKICLNVVELDECSRVKGKRSKYCDGIARNLFKSTSVNKLIILGIAPDVAETHANMFALWELLEIRSSFKTKQTRVATDLKMANILLGLMSHASCHPCSWCDVSR